MTRLRKIGIVLLCLLCWQAGRGEWTKQSTNTLAWLHDIYFFNENKGFIAGSGGTFLETTDGGKTWTKRKNFTDDNIRQIYFSDEYTGWLLCERDVFNRGQNSISYLMKTTDGGASWEKTEIGDLGRTRITRIFFNQKGKGFAVGETGALFELNDGGWEKSPWPVRYKLLGGAFSDDTHGAIVGAGGSVYFTEDAGNTWNAANLFGDKTARLNAVFFFNRQNGWAVGAGGKVFQTWSAGKTWREQNSRVTADLFDVFFANTAEGWAVGDEGLILHTQTGGNVWVVDETKVKHKLEKILFVGKKGFAVGFGGTILVNGAAAPVKSDPADKPQLLKRNKN